MSKIKTPSKKTVTNKLTKYAKVAFSIAATALILGLAFQGAKKYISTITPEQQTIVALLIVAGLAYIVVTGISSLKK